MATIPFIDASLVVNSVDLSDHVASVTVSYSADELDDTAMGDDTKSRLGGLKDWSIDVTWHQDFAASEVYATLWPLVGSTTTVAFKPTSAATSATNPQFSGTAFLPGIQTGGAVGSLMSASTTFMAASTIAIAES